MKLPGKKYNLGCKSKNLRLGKTKIKESQLKSTIERPNFVELTSKQISTVGVYEIKIKKRKIG